MALSPRIFLLYSIYILALTARCETLQPLPAFSRGFLSNTDDPGRVETPLLDTLHIDVSHTQETIPTWQFDEFFEFLGDWYPAQQTFVQHSLLGVMSMMMVSMNVLIGQPGDQSLPGVSNPSFLRYFNAGDLETYRAVLQRMLNILAAPNTEASRQCLQIIKIGLNVGDGPKGGTLCANVANKIDAHYVPYIDMYGVQRGYIAFCPLYFQLNRSWLHVQKQNLGKSIDVADVSQLPEVMSGASTLMHELLHWYLSMTDVLPQQIVDVIVTRPDDGKMYRAYRSFYATHAKDWLNQNGQSQSPLYNADCYVYSILEIYYRDHFSLPPWQDSPDPYLYQQGIPYKLYRTPQLFVEENRQIDRKLDASTSVIADDRTTLEATPYPKSE